MRLRLDLSTIFQGVIVALLIALLLGAWNFVGDMREFRGAVLGELKGLNTRVDAVERRLDAYIQRGK